MQRDGVTPRIVVEHAYLAPGLAGEAEQDAQGGGLAGAVRSEETVHPAGVDVEVETVEGVDVAVALGEAGGMDDARHAPEATPASAAGEGPCVEG